MFTVVCTVQGSICDDYEALSTSNSVIFIEFFFNYRFMFIKSFI